MRVISSCKFTSNRHRNRLIEFKSSKKVIFTMNRLLFQGNFTSWIDKSLVRETYWSDSRTSSFVNLTIYYLLDVYGITHIKQKEYGQRRVLQQPEFSYFKNCTAVVIDVRFPIELHYGSAWFVVSCDEVYNTSFICESRLDNQNSSEKITLSSSGCDKGWFQLQSHCFNLYSATSPVNYYDAQKECTLHNSSLLSVTAVQRSPLAGTALYFHIDYIKNILRTVHRKNPSYIPILTNDNVLENIISGMAPEADPNTRSIFEILTFFYKDTFFVLVNGRCGTMKIPFVLDYVINASSLISTWNVRYCECSAYFAFNNIVCVKSVEPISSHCSDSYFECFDKVCVLALYVCDSFNDCVEGEDETSCLKAIIMKDDFTLINNNLYLPCILHRDCKASVTNLVSPVKIHSFCDGIQSNKLLLEENKLCDTKRHQSIDQLDLIVQFKDEQTKYTFDRTIIQVKDIALEEFKKEIKLHHLFLNNRNLFFPTKNSINQTAMERLFVQLMVTCNRAGDSISASVANLCGVYPNEKQCPLITTQGLCRDISCNGMFKCTHFYCISVSAVCDGQFDCLYGEDESFCSNFTCPGLLKCRSESRCIGWEEICNGHVDCIQSADDEIMCGHCPADCTCDGFMLHCRIDNSLKNLDKNDLQSYKAIILEGNQSIISYEILSKFPVIYLDFSNCYIRHIRFGVKKYIIYQHIIFVDFSNNYLKNVKFLVFDIFFKVVVVDLTNNFIVFFIHDYIFLPYLQIIYLVNNPISNIKIGVNLPSIKFIDLHGVSYQLNIMKSTIINENRTLTIHVTDSDICCAFQINVNCTCGCNKGQCFAILKGKILKCVYYSSVLLTSTMTIIALIQVMRELASNYKWKKYYSTMKLNHILCDMLFMFSLIYIAIIDMTNRILPQWRHSIGCFAVHIIMSISLGLSSLCKISSLFIVAFRIMCPFEHQVQRLKYTSVVAALSWLLVTSLYISFSPVNIFNTIHVFDNFCSLCECHTLDFNNIFPVLICFLNLMVISAFIAVIYRTFVVLRDQTSTSLLASTISPRRIIINLTKHSVPQLFFTVTLLLVFFFKLLKYRYGQYFCLNAVAFIFTTTTFLGSVLNCLM